MIPVTFKISDINLAEGTFCVWIGNHGFPMCIDKLKEAASNVKHENINQEVLYYICAFKIWNKANQLSINPKDLTLTQIRSSIETEAEI